MLHLLAALAVARTPSTDTIYLTMGAPEVDARVYAPHRAKVLVRVGAPDAPVIAEWINELQHGDSAGRAVHRWITTGTQMPPDGPRSTWELRQTYDARALQPYASDLVPMAMELSPGLVIVAPMWGPNMQRTERRVFTVVGQEHKNVEGKHWNAWRIEERRYGDPTLLAVWFMVDESPYMVAGEVYQPNGQVRYMTEVALP